ncbi:hypothetical protein DDE83_003871 [Stemphylium lycopersici]|uniref:Uncharacterized protein n=1 Tax=Stemphylium lycopersici TaxID=183478 RepID=A0A364N6H0_STELY|nr:hypothetical protein DDE83_003871 [Stemphylium lycopersici]
MRSYRYAALFIGAALAQESATIINIFETASTLTLLGSDANATTYQNGCPLESAGISIVPFLTYTASEGPTATPAITPTPKPLIHRQSDSDNLVPGFCEPYNITQGSEVYGFHLTDPLPGAWTVDVVCNWQGDMSTANLTCDGMQTGFVPKKTRQFLFTSSVMSLGNLADDLNVVTIMSESATSSPVSPSLISASTTPTLSEAGTNALFGPDATAPSNSGSDATVSTSSGFAAAGPSPTGVMAMQALCLGDTAHQIPTTMVASIAETSSTPTAHPKSKLLSTLVRHISAPVHPLTVEVRRPTETGTKSSHRHFAPPPKTPQTPPRSEHSLLGELSLAQAHASCLRRDRDKWHSLALRQEQDLDAAFKDLEHQTQIISETEDENTKLKARHEEATTAGRQLYSRFDSLIAKHDKLVDEFNEATRTITRLKKSDRSKDKVQQRNLNLKATLRRYTVQGVSATTRAAADTESTLREALALATERIGELETKGEVLLDALEKRYDGSGSDDDEMDSGETEAELLEAEVAFRGVLEEESIKEQKENWAELLNE